MHTYIYSWQDLASETTLWELPADLLFSKIVMVLTLAGMLFGLSASFALDHFALFGLLQGIRVDFNKMFSLSAPV